MNPASTTIHLWRHVPWDVAQEIEVTASVHYTSVQPGNPTADSLLESTGYLEGPSATVAKDVEFNSRLAFKAGTPITLTEDEWQRADSNALHAARDRTEELDYV